jgi:very-short-patch-repair endonuclease
MGLLIVVAALVLIGVLIAKKKPTISAPSYRAKQLMHDQEHALYQRLTEALPDHQVFAQVSMSAIVEPTESGKQRQRARNFISQKYVDYVICDAKANPIAVVELDGRSHQRQDRQRADATKDSALNGAGIKVVRWTPKTLPKGEEIRAAILTTPTSSTAPKTSPGATTPRLDSSPSAHSSSATLDAAVADSRRGTRGKSPSLSANGGTTTPSLR